MEQKIADLMSRVINRLKEENNTAYLLLCYGSVYREPVEKDFWLSHLDDDGFDESQKISVLEVLIERKLINVSNHDGKIFVSQSASIREEALRHLKNF